MPEQDIGSIMKKVASLGVSEDFGGNMGRQSLKNNAACRKKGAKDKAVFKEIYPLHNDTHFRIKNGTGK